jgi:hypothetical protein
MDIKKLGLTTEPQKLILRHPVSLLPITQEDDKVTSLMIICSAHPDVRKIENEINQAGIQKLKKGIVNSFEDDIADENKRIVAHIVGWENFYYNGEFIDFDKKILLELVADPCFAWMRKQITSFIKDTANFIIA